MRRGRARWFRPPALGDVVGALLAWRWWLLLGLVGAGLGGLIYALWPPPYRARAEIIVDYNLEEALPQGTDRELFYFLSRENKKLRPLAWSDAVLTRTAATLGQSVDPRWRQGVLLLREEHDGAWHFWAQAATEEQARRLASAWAQAFLEVAREKIGVARRIQALQARAEAGRLDAEGLAELERLQADSAGLSPYIQLAAGQLNPEALPVVRAASVARYALLGAVAGMLLAFVTALWLGGGEEAHG